MPSAAGRSTSEVAPPDRLVCTEKFDEAWSPGEGIVTVDFIEEAGATTLSLTLRDDALEALVTG